MSNRARTIGGESGDRARVPLEKRDVDGLRSAAPLAAVNSRLEDALYLQADKLLALCAVQSAWAGADCEPSPATRNHYALVMEEQALELRRLLDRLFL
jgi:hypothetical protein